MSDSDSDEDALVDDVYAYLVQDSCPKECSSTRKKQIRKRAERFSVKEGNLYYRFKGRLNWLFLLFFLIFLNGCTLPDWLIVQSVHLILVYF